MYEILTFNGDEMVCYGHEDSLAEAAAMSKEASLINGYSSIWSFNRSDRRGEYFNSELMNEFNNGQKVWEPCFAEDDGLGRI